MLRYLAPDTGWGGGLLESLTFLFCSCIKVSAFSLHSASRLPTPSVNDNQHALLTANKCYLLESSCGQSMSDCKITGDFSANWKHGALRQFPGSVYFQLSFIYVSIAICNITVCKEREAVVVLTRINFFNFSYFFFFKEKLSMTQFP